MHALENAAKEKLSSASLGDILIFDLHEKNQRSNIARIGLY
jgi:hypothetical protein